MTEATQEATTLQIPPADLTGIDISFYEKVAAKMNTLGVGLPPTPGRHELVYWSKVFTHEEGAVLLQLEDDWTTAEEFAERTKLDPCLLEEMSKKALLYREKNEIGAWKYRPIPFAHGIIEFGYSRFAYGAAEESLHEYAGAVEMDGPFFPQFMSVQHPIFHTVPLNREFVIEGEILPTDDAYSILASKSRFAITACTCRAISPNPCNHPLDVCVATDKMADFYLETGMGRPATREEVMQIFADGEKDGRFIQIMNSQAAEIFCSCCGCNCGILNFPRLFPESRALKHWTNYRNTLAYPDRCDGCGVCKTTCHMNAITMADSRPVINQQICIGCSLCERACPSKALGLQRKPEDELFVPFENMWDSYSQNAVDILECEWNKVSVS